MLCDIYKICASSHGHFDEGANWQCEVVARCKLAGLKHHELALVTHNNIMFYVYVYDGVVGLE